MVSVSKSFTLFSTSIIAGLSLTILIFNSISIITFAQTKTGIIDPFGESSVQKSKNQSKPNWDSGDLLITANKSINKTQIQNKLSSLSDIIEVEDIAPTIFYETKEQKIKQTDKNIFRIKLNNPDSETQLKKSVSKTQKTNNTDKIDNNNNIPQEIINEIKTKLDTSYHIQPRIRYTTSVIDSDTLYNKQWSLNNTGQSHPVMKYDNATSSVIQQDYNGTAGQDINFENLTAQDTTNGGTGQVVAVTDTGLDYTHPDIENNVWVNQGEVPISLKSLIDLNSDNLITSKEILVYLRTNNLDYDANGVINLEDLFAVSSPFSDKIDGDNNGLVDDFIGWDFADNDNNPMDDEESHGTHVSGTIAASRNNNLGISGIAYNSVILPIRIIGQFGAFTEQIISGYNYTVGKAKVMNMSWGGDDNRKMDEVKDDLDYKAFQNMTRAGVIGINAAGNSSEDALLSIPTKYPEIIVVGSSDSDGKRSGFSNYGSKVDILAPGSDILSLKSKTRVSLSGSFEDKYLIYSGTSMASPHIAGLASLIVAKNPTITTEQLRQALHESGNKPSNFDYDYNFSFGIINGLKLFNANLVANSLLSYGLDNILDTEKLKNQKSFDIKVSDVSLSSWKLELGKISNEPHDELIPINIPFNLLTNTSVDTSFNLDTLSLQDGKYVLKLRGINGNQEFIKLKTFSVQNIEIDETFQIFGNRRYLPIKTTIPRNYAFDIVIDTKDLSGNVIPSFSCKNSLLAECQDTGIVGVIDSEGIENTIFSVQINTKASGSDILNFVGRKSISVDKSIMTGYPHQLTSEISSAIISQTIADIDNNGTKEIIAIESGYNPNLLTKSFYPSYKDDDLKLNVLDKDGKNIAGFPFLIKNLSDTSAFVRRDSSSKPLIIDSNKDGKMEIYFVVSYQTNAGLEPNFDPTVISPSEQKFFLYGVDNKGQLLKNYPKQFYQKSYIDEWPTLVYNIQLSASDFNNDGSLDFVVQLPTKEIILTDIKGNKFPGYPYKVTSDPTNDSLSEAKYNNLGFTPPVAISDINLDKKPEIISTNFKNLTATDNQGQNVFKPIHLNELAEQVNTINTDGPSEHIEDEFFYQSPVIVDLDLDGKPEIIAVSTHMSYDSDARETQFLNSTIMIFNNKGVLQKFKKFKNKYITGLSVGDLNQDKKPEISFVTNANNAVFQASFTDNTALNVLSSDLSNFNNFPVNLPGRTRFLFSNIRAITENDYSMTAPIIDDVNGDGANDILVAMQDQIVAYNSNGVTVDGFPRIISDSLNFTFQKSFVTLDDINGDGKKELINIYQSGRRFGSASNRIFDKNVVLVYNLLNPPLVNAVKPIFKPLVDTWQNNIDLSWKSVYGDDNNSNNLFVFTPKYIEPPVEVVVTPNPAASVPILSQVSRNTSTKNSSVSNLNNTTNQPINGTVRTGGNEYISYTIYTIIGILFIFSIYKFSTQEKS